LKPTAGAVRHDDLDVGRGERQRGGREDEGESGLQ